MSGGGAQSSFSSASGTAAPTVAGLFADVSQTDAPLKGCLRGASSVQGRSCSRASLSKWRLCTACETSAQQHPRGVKRHDSCWTHTSLPALVPRLGSCISSAADSCTAAQHNRHPHKRQHACGDAEGTNYVCTLWRDSRIAGRHLVVHLVPRIPLSPPCNRLQRQRQVCRQAAGD